MAAAHPGRPAAALVAAAALALAAGCSGPSPAPGPDPTTGPAATSAPTPSGPSTVAPVVSDVADPSTLTGKLVMGYQGWFSCPEDGIDLYNGYHHWIKDGFPDLDAESYRPEMWPDTGDLPPDERCATALTYRDGTAAPVYTAANPATVARHFSWMHDYGIDGVLMQRFGSQLIYPEIKAFQDRVLDNARAGAEAYGRVWGVEYDLTGTQDRGDDPVEVITRDWMDLVDQRNVTDSPAYLHHRGRPLVGLWGLGYDDHPETVAQALALLDFFQHNPDKRYRATVMGGVPVWWRTHVAPASTDPAWDRYYCRLDVISPWTVSAVLTDADVDTYYRDTVPADMRRARRCGADYLPVLHPGYSYHQPDPSRQFNEVPRRGGRLYWRQVHDAVDAGATMLFNAMFDEVDEATAMYKLSTGPADTPQGLRLVTLGTDGDCLPSDWYLRLAGAAGETLRGERRSSETIPLRVPRPTDGRRCPQPVRLRLRVTTTSDWTKVGLGGVPLTNLVVTTSAPGSTTSTDLSQGFVLLSQALPRAESGGSVEATVDVFPARAGRRLTVTIGRGSIGATTVAVTRVDRRRSTALGSFTWVGVDGTDANEQSYVVPLR